MYQWRLRSMWFWYRIIVYLIPYWTRGVYYGDEDNDNGSDLLETVVRKALLTAKQDWHTTLMPSTFIQAKQKRISLHGTHFLFSSDMTNNHIYLWIFDKRGKYILCTEPWNRCSKIYSLNRKMNRKTTVFSPEDILVSHVLGRSFTRKLFALTVCCKANWYILGGRLHWSEQ